MRVAVSGSHSTGKSTLIAAFLAQCPAYAHEPEAYEELADDIALLTSEGPDIEGLAALLTHTVSTVGRHGPGAAVIFERSPVDYLAYAAATRSIARADRDEFIRTYVPIVRAAVRSLDLIALLPAAGEGPVASRPGEDDRFRKRVDEELRRALIDDDYDVFAADPGPRVVEFSAVPDRQLSELVRLTANGSFTS
jgi:hypothetical protein